MKKHSVKIVISFWYTFILLLFMVIVLAGVVFISFRWIRGTIQNELTDEIMENIEDLYCSEGTYNFSKIEDYDDGVVTVIYDEKGKLIYGKVPSGFPEEVERKDETIQLIKGGLNSWYVYDYEYSIPPLEPVTFRGIVSVSREYKSIYSVMWATFIVIPLLTVIGAVVGYYITNRAFRPVAQIVSVVDEINNGNDLSKRIHLKGANDEIRALADTFDEMLNRIQVSFEREKQFTSDASHELRTPSAVIQAQCEYALTQMDNQEELKESIKIIGRQSHKMTKLISQLLVLARADHKQYPLQMESFHLTELAEVIAEEMNQKQSVVAVSVETAADVLIMADQTLIMQMLMNVIENGIKYGRQDGYVKISIQEKETNIIITIMDNGIGIAEPDLSKIWNRFYQVDSSRLVNQDNSMGLGLSMVKWIIEIHSGEVTVSSKLGEGTIFTIKLPKNL